MTHSAIPAQSLPWLARGVDFVDWVDSVDDVDGGGGGPRPAIPAQAGIQ